MSRAGNRQSSIYLGKDGHWHGRVTVGRKDDGSEDRRHVMSKSKARVVAKVRALERLRDEARVPKAGRAWTVEKWLLHWLEEIARPNIRDSSYQAYRTAITKHLLPVIGNLRLDRLEPEHVEAVHRRMADAGAKPATVHQVHRTLRTALGEAERRSHLARNPAQLVRPPRSKLSSSNRSTSERSSDCSEPHRSGATGLVGPSRWRSACARARPSLCGGRTSTWRQGRSGCAPRACGLFTTTGATATVAGRPATAHNDDRPTASSAPPSPPLATEWSDCPTHSWHC